MCSRVSSALLLVVSVMVRVWVPRKPQWCHTPRLRDASSPVGPAEVPVVPSARVSPTLLVAVLLVVSVRLRLAGRGVVSQWPVDVCLT